MKKIVLYFLILFLVSSNTISYCQDTVEIIWQKVLGRSGKDGALSVVSTSDGGYIVVGWTESNDGDVSGWHEGYTSYDNSPSPDFWIVKLGWK